MGASADIPPSAHGIDDADRRPGATRREFLRWAGAGLAVVTSGAIAAGCGRALQWSDHQGLGTETSMRPAASSTTGATTTDTAGASGPAVGGASTTTTGDVRPPDLAVFTGAGPEANVRAAVAAMGGMERFVPRGARVVLKPNVLTGQPPEYATTTNPTVIATVATLCYEAGASSVTVLDRPTSSARNAFEVSGIAAAASAVDAEVKYLSDRNFETIAIPDGRKLTAWPLVTDVFEADVFINIPIGKTHGMAGLTMSMKNLMGIMGGSRGLIHLDFSQKIVDLCTLVRPHLVVLDATRILTRNGPTGGDLADVKALDTVLVGTDQVTVDAYGTTLFGKRPQDLAYLVAAADQGLGRIDIEALTIAGTPAA